MFARIVSLHLKADSTKEFTRTMEEKVVPLLRKQRGFRDIITFVAPGGLEAVGISFWDQKEYADDYNNRAYQDVRRVLAEWIEGPVQVRNYEVSTSTFHKITARRAA